MEKQEKRLTIEEANEKVEKGVNELEAVINEFNHSRKRDKARRAKLASVSMSLVVRRFGLAAPAFNDTLARASTN